MSLLKKFNKILIAGLVTIFPILATIYLFYWTVSNTENILGKLIKVIIPTSWYRPGMGLAAGVIILLLIGALMQAWLMRLLMTKVESVIYRVPLIKSIYGAIREFAAFLSRGEEKGPRQVVSVSFNNDFKIIGLVTKENLADFSREFGSDTVAVYLPMSYQIGGYTIIVPRSSIEPLDMPLEKAMRFIMTAGVVGNENKRKTT